MALSKSVTDQLRWVASCHNELDLAIAQEQNSRDDLDAATLMLHQMGAEGWYVVDVDGILYAIEVDANDGAVVHEVQFAEISPELDQSIRITS